VPFQPTDSRLTPAPTLVLEVPRGKYLYVQMEDAMAV
jgi:hypothetical protein